MSLRGKRHFVGKLTDIPQVSQHGIARMRIGGQRDVERSSRRLLLCNLQGTSACLRCFDTCGAGRSADQDNHEMKPEGITRHGI
jgi:hypothetical protein